VTTENSFLNVYLHLAIDGSSFMKNQALLFVEILQHTTTMISIAKGAMSFLFMCFTALWGLSHDGTWISISNQQFLANGYLKNRCLSLSSIRKASYFAPIFFGGKVFWKNQAEWISRVRLWTLQGRLTSLNQAHSEIKMRSNAWGT
jgi:hypothetical protein